ncbi:putative sulfate exporter family transporter [Fertoebacter nigrum]|uniref:Putative sulfate exporter family transporter n=1 Tax=Fertoeibacter niger TaxID=2656921 RepID=A0A8X8GVL5_9RHOB|nr:putative sulfate exporter family transporter [Fertoeibacter niger]NUB45138.1 putative sulfate exporter family transporter [Fertoeibacter niger]
MAVPVLTKPFWQARLPGLAVAALVAVTAQFLSEHYGAPAMLMAILLGIALHFLSEEGKTVVGIEFAAKGVLRLGVGLLGVRISLEMFLGLGAETLALVLGALVATICFGLLAARGFGQSRAFGFLTGGAVAICGASAAMAIAAVLPRHDKSERDLVFTVVGVTVLSTMAMIVYPILAGRLGLDAQATGIFFGGTIHDVAQVVGAGFSVSEETGEFATLVKLIRVTALAPVVLIAALLIRAQGAGTGPRPPLVPGFVLAFLALAALNSLGLIPAPVIEFANGVSRWALLTAIAAVGMKTSIPGLLKVGGPAISLLVVETVFLALLVLGGGQVIALF